MKARNLNNASRRTRATIKKTFAELLAEKRELSKITVTELVTRAGLSRGAFYSHYDDIFSVAEDDEFIDTLFRYLRENDNNYKLLCRSNESLFSAKKLCNIACAKLLELCNDNPRCVDKQYLEIEINVFVSGLTFEYIRYCRGSSTATLDELHDYTKQWAKGFTARRTSKY